MGRLFGSGRFVGSATRLTDCSKSPHAAVRKWKMGTFLMKMGTCLITVSGCALYVFLARSRGKMSAGIAPPVAGTRACATRIRRLGPGANAPGPFLAPPSRCYTDPPPSNARENRARGSDALERRQGSSRARLCGRRTLRPPLSPICAGCQAPPPTAVEEGALGHNAPSGERGMRLKWCR